MEEARKIGFTIAGIYEGATLSEESKQRLKEWIDKGYMGEMRYLSANDHDGIQRRTTLKKLNSSYQSLIVFAARYEQAQHPGLENNTGRVARYAWGRDYHRRIPKKIRELLRDLFPHEEVEHHIFSDATPLMERAFAKEAGLGFVGKNTLLITPGAGSLFLLGGMVWNVKIIRDDILKPKALSAILSNPHLSEIAEASCGSCSRCIDNCPTKAIVGPYSVDARRCISYLTIELRRAFTDEEKEMVGEWLFGCDVCQDVCPHNHTTLKVDDGLQPIEELTRKYGCGPLMNLKDILHIKSDEEFLKKFAGTPLMRAKRTGLIRNAACVAANTGCVELVQDLKMLAENSNESEIVRDAAQWAVKKLTTRL